MHCNEIIRKKNIVDVIASLTSLEEKNIIDKDVVVVLVVDNATITFLLKMLIIMQGVH